MLNISRSQLLISGFYVECESENISLKMRQAINYSYLLRSQFFCCCSSFGKYAYFICYQLKGASGVEAIKVAIDAGYRLFDTAFLYGNEDIVGEAIREKCVEGSTNREEITVISKLWSIHHDLVEKVETNVKLA